MRTPLLLYGLALVVRLVLIWHFPDPAYPDASYYVDVARALHAGSGFNIDFVWIFPEVGGQIPVDPRLPIPSNAHWMPLASIVQLPFLAILGPSAIASALPFAIIGAAAAPLTWAIARDAGARPIVGQAAGILTAIPLLSLVYMVQPDNFSLYQPLVAGALWMGARGLKGSQRSFALAGLLAGLATLSRNDGLLVLGAIVLAFLWYRWRRWRAGTSEQPAVPVRGILACIALFVLVMAPWWARQLAVFGSLSPSTTSGKVLFIREIAEWNSITIPATLQHLLGMGAMPLLATRIGGLVAASMIFATLIAGFVLVPFMVIGAWVRRRSVDFGPFFLYALALFGFSTLVSAVHVPGGTFIHSAVALAPHGYILAVEGIVLAVLWIAARRPRWDPTVAIRVFVGATIAFAAFAAFAGSLVVHSSWQSRATRFTQIADALDHAGAATTDRVMSIDAAGTRYWTGRGGVVLVNDPLDTIEEVARAYDIRWLVLDRGDSVAAVAPILDGGPLPPWLGDPILELGTPLQLAIYPVRTDR
jgi:hypothetical protein